jgi:hypothetical protein
MRSFFVAGVDRRMANGRRTRKQSRKHRSRKTKRGGGYVSSQQYFDPDVLPPATLMPAPSTAATPEDIRPILYATVPPSALLKGGRRTSRRGGRRTRGGFSPSVMGGFLANAEKAIVPLALYMVYHTFVPKKGTRRSSRRSRK